MNRSVHSSELLPKFTLPLGIKWESNLPVAVIVSELALPRFTFPFALSVLARSRVPAISTSSFRLMWPLPFPVISTLPSEF